MTPSKTLSPELKAEAFAREVWAQLTTRTFALWEVVLFIVLAGKQFTVPWWIFAPVSFVWLIVRSIGR